MFYCSKLYTCTEGKNCSSLKTTWITTYRSEKKLFGFLRGRWASFSIKPKKKHQLKRYFTTEIIGKAKAAQTDTYKWVRIRKKSGRKNHTTSLPSKCSILHAAKLRNKTKAMGNWRQSYLFHVYPHAMMMRISRCLQRIGFFFATIWLAQD